MAKSRYSASSVIGGHHYGTWSPPSRPLGYAEVDLLKGVRTFKYVIQVGDRVDHLAARFLNDENLWWVICLGNKIVYPFSSGGFRPGREIDIPVDAKDVVDKVVG